MTTDDRCTYSDLPVDQCGCTRHHRHNPSGTVITAAALERIIGRPAPEYRTQIRLDTDSGTLMPNAKPLDRIPTNADIICHSCGHYPHSRDRWLCDWCVEQWETDLRNAPTLAAELDKAIAKQARMTDGAGRGGGDDNPLPFNPSAARARARLNKAAIDAAQRLGIQPWTAAALLAATRNTIAQHREAPDLAAELRAATRQALATIDRPRPTTYLGPCPTCRLATHVPEGATTHTCPCGQIIIVAQALAAREAAIADVLVTWRELLDAHIAPRSTLYWWRSHRLLVPVTDWCGQPMYRLGDAKDLRDGKTGVGG